MTLKKTFYIFLLFAVLCGIFQLLPFDLQNILHYHSDQMPSGWFYLWLTPHLIHLGFLHYLINLLSFGIVLLAFRTVFTPLRLLFLFGFKAFYTLNDKRTHFFF